MDNKLDVLDVLEDLKDACKTHMGHIVYVLHEDDFDFIKKELSNYNEIKKIAEHYHFEDLSKDIFNIETEQKWQLKFRAGIVDIQEDYRKARALEIIKKKRVDVYPFFKNAPLSTYNFFAKEDDRELLTQEEFDLLKEVLHTYMSVCVCV